MLVIAGMSVRLELLLGTPPTVTMTLPVEAPPGTANIIDVSLQLCGVTAEPLKTIVLVP